MQYIADCLEQSPVFSELPQCLAVAWSGGLDSTALLLALQHKGFEVEAWHIDHAWHAASASDGQHLQAQAQAWNIPFFSRRLMSAPSRNREAAARQGRYLALCEIAKQRQIQHVCLAHHADDQAETVCLRLLQGAGVMGARGMQPMRSMHGLSWFRPLLHVPRAHLQAALQQADVIWLEDASNQDVSLQRNRVRLQLFPAMLALGVEPQQLFLRWSKQAKRLAAAIDAQVQQLQFDYQIQTEHTICSIDWQQWQCQNAPVRAQVLQTMVEKVKGAGAVLGRRHILLVETWQRQGGNNGLDLCGCRLFRQQRRLHLVAAKAAYAG